MSTSTSSINGYDQVQSVQAITSSISTQDRAADDVNSDGVYLIHRKNFFALAIEHTLAQIGVFGSSGTSNGYLSPVNNEQQQKTDYFMMNLLASMQSQSSQSTQTQGDNASNTTVNSGTLGVSGYEEHNYHRAGDSANIQTELQSLIQQLSLFSNGLSVNSSTDSNLLSLEQSFHALFTLGGAFGGLSDSQMTLGLFLIALAKNIDGIDSAGNFVNLVD